MTVVGLWAAAGAIAIVVAVAWWGSVRRVEIVYSWEAALLYRDGAFKRILEPGRHIFIDPGQRIYLVRVPTSPRHVRFGAIDVVSSDGFAFRLHLALTYRITDARAVHEEQAAPNQFGVGDPPGLHDRVATVAMAAVAGSPLDAVATAPAALGETIQDGLTLPHLAIEELLVVRIELPPETRRILSEVERARREGLAALERARGEHAALRSLANAARLVRDNPELAQLRLLQTIDQARRPATIVLAQPGVPVGVAPSES